jgi:hypothetical protein
MTTYLTASIAEQHRADLLAEADSYRRTSRARQVPDETAPRPAAHRHHWGHAFRAFMKDMATAQL